MQSDPSQKTNVADRYPDVTQDLARQYEAWFQDVTQRELRIPPIPIGAVGAEYPVVTAPAHESRFEGAVKFIGRAGWANDWLTNWTSKQDRIFWDLEVLSPGDYQLEILYTCKEPDIGSTIEVTLQGQSHVVQIDKAHDPDPLPSPDHIERKEVYEKQWAALPVGSFGLEPGKATVQLQALELPGSQVADIKGLRFIQLK